MALIIHNFETVYIDDNWNNDNSCPVPCEDYGCCFDENGEECYWTHDNTNELDFLDDIFNVKF